MVAVSSGTKIASRSEIRRASSEIAFGFRVQALIQHYQTSRCLPEISISGRWRIQKKAMCQTQTPLRRNWAEKQSGWKKEASSRPLLDRGISQNESVLTRSRSVAARTWAKPRRGPHGEDACVVVGQGHRFGQVGGARAAVAAFADRELAGKPKAAQVGATTAKCSVGSGRSLCQ